MTRTMSGHTHDIIRGVVGVLATGGTVALSLSDVEAWLRIASLCVGILVGLLTAWSLVRRIRGSK